VLPAREQLGDLLAELGRPGDALAEYEASLKTSPARFRTFWGAAQAADRSGDTAKAKTYYTKLIELCGSGDATRSEVAEAKSRLK
jgi:tetratricopeptide (TPR) repeat protein